MEQVEKKRGAIYDLPLSLKCWFSVPHELNI